ncbi:MAG: glycerophosphodiester phosphodiesterase [Lachnospiraceae bacterium]|nr:glycerophosphodiester phosphodiesterase [Lachnospiraceae bacterium]
MDMLILWILILLIVYVVLVAPRMIGRPARALFLGRDYAHRGLFDNASVAPENSLAAFAKAVKAGYGIEWDVQLSKDDIPVIFHDASLERMCGVKGNVWDYTLKELKEFRLGNSEEKIPTLEEALALVNGRVPLIIEYKLDRVQTRVCALANEQLKNYKGAYCIESFHPLALLWYKKNRPDVMRGQLSEEFWKEDKKYTHFQYYALAYLISNVATRPDFVAYNHKYHKNLSRRLHALLGGVPVCYTVKNQTDYEEAKKHFQMIIFDSFIPR